MNDKLRFRLLFTVNGIFFAEVCSRSSPDALYNPITFVFLFTVYGLYYLFAGSYLLSRGRYKDRRKVYAFGTLFGLYEFPITKVFFEPDAFYRHHVNFLNVFRIGFVRHAFMSFTMPFYLTLFLTLDIDKEIAELWTKRIFLVSGFFFSSFAPVLGADVVRRFLNPLLYFFYISLLIPKDVLKDVTLNRKRRLYVTLFFYVLRSALRRQDRRPRDPIAYIFALAFLAFVLITIFKTPFRPKELHGEPRRPSKRFLLKYLLYYEILSFIFLIIGRLAFTLVWILFVIVVLSSFAIVPYLFYRCWRG